MAVMRQTRSRGSHGDGRQAGPDRWLARAAWAGIAGPVLFTAGFLAQEALRTGDYSPIAETVSALEAGPYGWVQQVNFVVLGLLTLAFAIGLHRGLRPSRAGVAGPALLAISGLGALGAAAFPLREDEGGLTYDPGGHAVAGMAFFLASALGLSVLSRRLARDPRWRGLARYTLLAGLAGLVSFVPMRVLVIPDGAPLHGWAGLAQRVIVLAVLFPCEIVLSLRLLRIARSES